MLSQFSVITKSASETKKIAENLAKEILAGEGGAVLGLKGNLGGGKTTFVQGFAKGLGIKEKILSPTFNIFKKYKNFYHIDCYRIKREKEAIDLGFQEIFSNPENIVAVEWPENIKKIMPERTIWLTFKVIGENKRKITIKQS